LGGTHNALVYNNILLGPAGLDSTWSAIYLGFGTDNAQICNNTIYNCMGYPVGLRAGETTNVIIRNNIAWECGRTTVENAAQALAIDHNLNFTGGSVVDPQFIDAAANDFRLRPGSPAIGTGIVLPNSLSINSPPDMGASPSVSRGQPPSPTNLRLVVN